MMMHAIRNIISMVMLLCICGTAVAQVADADADMFATMRGSDRAAVIAVHMGHCSDSRAALSEARFSTRLKAAFPQCAFREAWVTRTPGDGVERRMLGQVLSELCQDGFTHLVVQPTCLLDGADMEYVRHEVALVASRLKDVRIGEPLFSSDDSYARAVNATAAAFGKEKSANVFVAMPSELYSPQHIAMLEYMMHDKGFDNWFTTAVTTFPTTEQLVARLKEHKQKKLRLIPLSYCTVDEPLLTDLHKQLQQNGCKATMELHSMGEVEDVQVMLVEHALDAARHRSFTPVEEKLQNVQIVTPAF